MKDNILELFPTPIFCRNLNSNLFVDELLVIKQKINEKDTFEISRSKNLTTIEGFILDNWKLSKIKREIAKAVKTFADEILCFNYDNFYITQSWININPPGSSHHTHKHINSVLSGVLFLNTFEGCGNIKFYSDQYTQHFSPKVTFKEDNRFTWGHYYVKPVNYDLLIFPSHLQHCVDKNITSDGKRISLSFNTFFTPLGDDLEKTLLPNLDRLNSEKNIYD